MAEAASRKLEVTFGDRGAEDTGASKSCGMGPGWLPGAAELRCDHDQLAHLLAHRQTRERSHDSTSLSFIHYTSSSIDGAPTDARTSTILSSAEEERSSFGARSFVGKTLMCALYMNGVLRRGPACVMYVCMYVCMHACLYVCTYVCMHACMYMYVYVQYVVRGMGTAPMGTILTFASVSPRKMETLLLGSWWP